MRRRTARTVFVLAPAVLLAGLAAAALRLWHVYVTPVPGPAGREKVVHVVEKGSGVRRVADRLARAGVVRSPWPFVFGYKVSFRGRSVKAGEYEFTFPLAPRDALRVLVEGRVRLYLLTVPEGLTGPEVGDVLARHDFLGDGGFAAAFRNAALIADWDPAARDLEGYLFPDSYNVPRGTSTADLVAAMVAEFRRVNDEGRRRRAAELRMSVREVVTLASLIEEYTALPEERPRVAAVFHNRLRLGRARLRPDDHLRHEARRSLSRRLLKKDLDYPSPYNTYLRGGLPPGPICSPGLTSLDAALHPAADDALYFVARGDGSHAFSRTWRDHQTAVRNFQLQKK
jgi:UPF0755 protein